MNPQTDSGIPVLVWGFGDPHFGLGIPKSVWGCESQQSPNRFGDPQTKTGIPKSPYQNGDPRIGLGIVQSRTRIGMGFIPIWGPTVLGPKLEYIDLGIPIAILGHPKLISKSGCSRIAMGFIPIWGPTYILIAVNYFTT